MVLTGFDAFFKGIDGFDSLVEFGSILSSLVIEAVASIVFGGCDFVYIVTRAVFKCVPAMRYYLMVEKFRVHECPEKLAFHEL